MMKTPSRQEKAPVTQSCGTCRYYKSFDHDLDEESEAEDDQEDDPEAVTGVCRRYPPQLFPGIISTTAWPEVTDKSGWCGEYTPRE